jgi:hypothetical protein
MSKGGSPYLSDMLYFDVDKAASIYSQLQGGLLRETQETTEQGRDRRRGLAVNLAGFKPEMGSTTTDRTSVLETRVMHHDLLLHLEEALGELGAAVDISARADEVADASSARGLLEEASYVRAEGRAVLEDWERLRGISGEFPDLLEFINKCAMSGLEGSEELQALKAAIEQERGAAARLPKQQRSAELRRLDKQEREFLQALKTAVAGDTPPEQWLIDGIQRWIDVFMPGRITLRVYPFEHVPGFQIVGNLKRDAFVDADLGNLLFAYGPRPNVKLTVFGLVTSVPPEGDDDFDPLAEFAGLEEVEGNEALVFEKSFRGVFEGMEGMERFSRFSRYPNVTVYPLAVYRRVPVSEPD